MSEYFRIPELRQIQDPGTMGQVANALSARVNPTIGQANAFLARVQESGLPLATARSLAPVSPMDPRGAPYEAIMGLANLPGAQAATRFGARALAGQRGVDALFGAREQPAQGQAGPSVWEILGDISRAGAPIQGPEQAPQAQGPMPGYGQLGMPQLPDLQPFIPPDFSAAREAIGGPIEAEEISRGDRLARVLGAAAAGGLSAERGSPAGRPATIGEILAGIGAGTGAESAAMSAEAQKSKEVAQQQELYRQRMLSNVESMQAAATAATDRASAEAYNTRAMQEAQLKFSVERFNIEQMRPMAVTGGYVIPATGEFVSTGSKLSDTLEVINWVQELIDKSGTQTAAGFGQELTIKNIPENLQLSTAAAIQASKDNGTVRLAAEMLKLQKRETEASHVLMLLEGSKAGMTKEQINGAQAALTDILSTMIFENWSAELQGKDVPYVTLNHKLWLSQAEQNPQLRTTAGQQALISRVLGGQL
jgi:hypothetical protein